MGLPRIEKAMEYMSLLPQDRVTEAFLKAFPTTSWHAILQSPGAPISYGDIVTFKEGYNTVDRQIFQLMSHDRLFGTALGSELVPAAQLNLAPRYYEYFHTYPDGKVASIGFRPRIKMDVLSYRPSALVETDEMKYNKLLKDLQKYYSKFGTPETASKRVIGDVKAEKMIKASLLRFTAKRALQGGCVSAAMRGVFDIKLLFDGEFKKYLAHIGISGLYGASLEGLSKWIRHPFFGNGMVLGILIGTAFNAVSLAESRDWVRFGKNIAMDVIGAATGYGGAATGFWLGVAIGGPFTGFTAPIFGLAGSLIGSYCGAKLAKRVPGLRGVTETEILKGYEHIKKQLAAAGLEPDPSMPPRQFMTAIFSQKRATSIPVRHTKDVVQELTDLDRSLQALYDASDEKFAKFVATLCKFVEEQK